MKRLPTMNVKSRRQSVRQYVIQTLFYRCRNSSLRKMSPCIHRNVFEDEEYRLDGQSSAFTKVTRDHNIHFEEQYTINRTKITNTTGPQM